MKFLRTMLDRLHPHFDKGGRFEKLYPAFEAIDTFLYTPGQVSKGATHVRDAIDLKRMMSMVVVALIPCTLMAMWNAGYQANRAIAELTAAGIPVSYTWQHSVHTALGLGHNPGSIVDCFVYGALFFLPIYIVCMAVGGTCEAIFSIVRGHEINEGFLVTGLLFPLVLPPNLPLYQVALGIAFGVVIGKEIFGGTGRNFLNPALTARAFLYFGYAGQISGNNVWVATNYQAADGKIDGFSGATPLGQLAQVNLENVSTAVDSLHSIATTAGVRSITWWEAFVGTIPGSFGETSALACLIGAAILIATGVGSWRIMSGTVIGAVVLALTFNLVGSNTNPMFQVSPLWHLVIGGFAFGTVFMCTDPVSASMTDTGKWIYGLLIGAMTILIRVVNPAFPEGIMLAILFGNVFAPLIDYGVAQANIKRRSARYAT
jgi:Na+-transporting NADH:ubiquinone oxidoreductase subunit B